MSAETTWVDDGADQSTAAVTLMPFAGIAFLRFVGTIWLTMPSEPDEAV